MPRLLVCTGHGLVRLDGTARSWGSAVLLEEAQAPCVAAGGVRLLVGTRDGALLSTDEGARWWRADLPEPNIFSVAIGAGDGTSVETLGFIGSGTRLALSALTLIDRWRSAMGIRSDASAGDDCWVSRARAAIGSVVFLVVAPGVVIDTWLEYKREQEIDQVRIRPHPWEFHLYYDI
jgi:hypothetical protein